jgi:uncharacterized protein
MSEALQPRLDEGESPDTALPAVEVIVEATPLATAHVRLAGLDALRGFALLGILVVNLPGIAWPAEAPFLNLLPLETAADRAAHSLVRLLAMGRFYPLYALLFGVGLGFLLRQTSLTGGAPARGPVVRRCLVLLGLGMGHAVLIWSGDILLTYGITGLLLMAMARWPRGAIWGVTFAASGFVFLLILGMAGLLAIAGASPAVAATFAELDAEQARVLAEELAATHTAFGQGTWWEALRYRVHAWGTALAAGLGTLPFVAAMAAVGFVVVRDGALDRGLAQPQRWRRVRAWSLVLAALLGLASWALYPSEPALSQTDPRMLTAVALQMPAGAAQAVGLLALAITLPSLGTGLLGRALARAGRLSLSHYLLQSIVMTALFSAWGAGLYGRLGPGWLLAISLGFWGLQVAVSGWWLARFRLGPAEWLWRSLVAGKAQPFRRVRAEG